MQRGLAEAAGWEEKLSLYSPNSRELLGFFPLSILAWSLPLPGMLLRGKERGRIEEEFILCLLVPSLTFPLVSLPGICSPENFVFPGELDTDVPLGELGEPLEATGRVLVPKGL